MNEGSRQSGGSQRQPPRPPSSTPVTRAPPTRRLPKIGSHASGQARVTLGSVVHDLGRGTNAKSRSISSPGVITTYVVPSFHRRFRSYATGTATFLSPDPRSPQVRATPR